MGSTKGTWRGASPAIVVAALALVAALAGTAIAGPDAHTRALSKKKVKKISKKEIKKAAPGLSVDNAENLGGEPASAYETRYASVLRNGTIVSAESKGITQANVNRESAGFYCVDGLDPAPKSVVATLSANADAGARIYASKKSGPGVCAGKQLIIQTQNNALTNTDEPFTVLAL